MDYIVCIGNGLHTDGSTSRINQAIIKKAAELWRPENIIILSGGYKNKIGVTEAESMEGWLAAFFPRLKSSCVKENKSYRTHNNAVEALKIAQCIMRGKMIVIDHPQHLERTLLSFETVNRLYFNDRFEIIGCAAEEVYDSNIPGQEYWATKGLFREHERKSALLYNVLLFRPWSRLGLWVLRKVWPSEKQ